MKIILSFIIFSLIIWSCSIKKQFTPQKTQAVIIENSAIEAKIKDLLVKMTLKEKVGQMLNIGLSAVLKGDYWNKKEQAVFDSVKFKKLVID